MREACMSQSSARRNTKALGDTRRDGPYKGNLPALAPTRQRQAYERRASHLRRPRKSELR
jgi:hypothetical protein